MSGRKLITIGVVLALVNALFSRLPHYNFFEGAWMPSSVDYMDVTWGAWTALVCVWMEGRQ